MKDRTIHSFHSAFDPEAALKAIAELSRMDGDFENRKVTF